MKSILLGIALLLLPALARGDALYKQGTAVYETNPVQAFGLFVQAAEEGNPSAMAGAGHCCETGTGTSVDYAIAMAYVRNRKFEEAVRFQKNAIEALLECHRKPQDSWAPVLEKRLTLYKQGKPYSPYEQEQ